MTRCTVSVIMPAYNAQRHIEQAVRSVLAQRGVSFELLVGDDGSTDATWSVIEKYRQDPRVRAWKLTRRGAALTRNTLARKARGDYLALCDADDRMLAGHLRILAQELRRHRDVGVAYGKLRVEDARSGRRYVHQPRSPEKDWDLLGGSVWNPGTMIRRSVFEQIGGYQNFVCFEDVDLFLRLAEATSFRPVPGAARYIYRIRRGGLSDQPKYLRRQIRTQIRREAILRRYNYRTGW